MKYFSVKWWNADDEPAVDAFDAFGAYREHFERIRQLLPSRLVDFSQNLTLHDAEIASLTISDDRERADLRLLGDGKSGCLRRILLQYEELKAAPILDATEPGTIISDEIDITENGEIEHCLLLSYGQELTFGFSKFDYRWEDDLPLRQIRRQGGIVESLEDHDEDERRFIILDAIWDKDARYVPQFLARLSQDETPDNRRHIVRALGRLGGPAVADALLDLAESEDGLILADIAQAFGWLRCQRAKAVLEQWTESPIHAVREKARFGLKCLKRQS